MADQWYYAAGEDRQGPFSAQQLRQLAVAGSIRPTDTVWKEGVAQGVPAAKVKNLFPPAPTPPPQASAAAPEAAAPAAASVEVAEDVPTGPAAEAPADPPAESPAETPAAPAAESIEPENAPETAPPPQGVPRRQDQKNKAMAIRGAVIVSQDGTSVYFRKKCTRCGQEDNCRSRMLIRPGMTRQSYFCRKCRKVSPIEILGTAG
jgi:hypothetical protein